MCVPWKTRGVLFEGKRVYFHRLKKRTLENEKLMLPEWTVSGNGGIFMGNRKKADDVLPFPKELALGIAVI